MAIKTIFITSGTTFTIPADFGSLVSVECIGGGGSGGTSTTGGTGGGGGGAYAKSTAVTGLTASGTAYVSIGAGGTAGAGGDTWFNAASNAAPTLTSQGALAKAGAVGALQAGGAGGLASTSVGTTKFNGGTGGVG